MSEHDNGWEFAKRLSDALLKVRPLGGSELFVKRNNNYYADPNYCGQIIDEMRASLDQEIRARIRLEKALTETVSFYDKIEREHAPGEAALLDKMTAVLSRVGTAQVTEGK